MASNTPTVDIRSWTKRFGGTLALDDVSLTLERGEIHGLIGQNGSGKSTVVKILAGYHAPETGASLLVNGREIPLPVRPGSAARLGLCFVHQDMALDPSMNIMETIALGRGYSVGFGSRIRWGVERRRVAALLSEFGLAASPGTLIRELSSVQKAIVAILRALQQLELADYNGLLILDEPTVFLPRSEVARLFSAVKLAAGRGAAVLFVSHQLNEIRELCDLVTVLRDGRRVWTGRTDATTEEELVRQLLGRDLGGLYPDPSDTESHEDVVLEVSGLHGDSLQGLTFALGAGEILGVTGLVGMGQDDLPYLLFGARSAERGDILLHGSRLTALSPERALRAGLALVPADRTRQGAFPEGTISENMTVVSIDGYFRKGWLRQGQERRVVTRLMDEYDVRPRDPSQPFFALSGGNQQKVILAKWLQTQPKVLILHEPTQGVDMGARQQIFKIIRACADQGTAVLLCSSEYEDLAHLCDRVLVLKDGRQAATLSAARLTEDLIIDEVHRSSLLAGD